MVLNACHGQPLPPSGMAYAVALRLTGAKSTERRNAHRGSLLSHLVTARDDVVNVYEVRRSVTEGGGEQDSIYHLRSHQIFGSVTGLDKCRIDSYEEQAAGSSRQTAELQYDTLVVSFKDAKMALMQWSDAEADLITISIHTYERAPQVSEGVPSSFRHALRLDPASRCVALLVPQDCLAILPFYNDTVQELDDLVDRAGGSSTAMSLDVTLPYAPSFVLSLSSTDHSIRNVRDFVFLPNFQRPTIAVLYEKDETWTGRLDERHDTCAIRIITLDLTTSDDASHRVISSRDGLPFNSRFLTACPQSVGGGVIVTSDSALIHMDQGGKIVGAAVNDWHSLTSKLPLPRWTSKSQNHQGTNGVKAENGEEAKLTQLVLANSHLVFPDERTPLALLFLADGNVWQLTMRLEGRSIASLSLDPRGSSVQPSLAIKIPLSDLLLVGCLVGDAHLLRLRASKEGASKQHDSNTFKVEDDDMDLDADLYGEQATTTTNGGEISNGAITSFELHVAYEISQLGSLLHVAPAVTGDLGKAGGLAQTVVCCGAGKQGGLALLEPQIVPRNARQLVLNATNGLWTIRYDEDKGHTVLLASNANASEIVTLSTDGDLSGNVVLKGRTIYADRLTLRDHALLRVTERAVEIIKEDGRPLRRVELGRGRPADVDIFKAEHTAGILTILWTDGTLQMFSVRKDQLKEISLPEEVGNRKYVAAGIIVDKYRSLRSSSGHSSGTRETTGNSSLKLEDEEVDYGEEMDDKDEAEIGGDAKRFNTYVALTSSEACVQLYTWPHLQRVWQSNSLYPAPSRLDYTLQAAEEEEVPSLEISQVQFCHVGDTLHLAVAYQNGLLNIFEANPFSGEHKETAKAYETADANALILSFIKVAAKQLDVVGAGMLDAPNGDSVEGVSLIPFSDLGGHDGLFVGGVAPAWLLREPHGLARLYMSAERSMDHLCVTGHLTKDNTSQYIFVQYGIVNVANMPVLDYSLPVAHRRKARTQRTYTNATPHPVTKTIVAASIVEQEFVLFDPEDGHVVEDPSSDPTLAQAPRSVLELFVDEDGEPVDGYEFQQCEVVNSLELVTLRSVGSMSGLKDYIAVGTIISYGEDRPARGATYVFDVVETVAPTYDPAARYKLRLLVKDDCKGPITNVSDINGYLIIVMGLKLFIRSLEKDEWLITVAFLDTPYQLTSVQRLKNFLLLTDVHKSVWFVAFQEEPYRLVVISKDYNDVYQSCGSFLIREEDMTIVAAAKDGTLRLYDYAPSIPASQGGQKLLARCEFACDAEASCRMSLPGTASNDGGIATSNEVLFSTMNGSIQVLQPVDEEIFNVLHLLQGQLVRNVQHFAGLHPRAYRAVRNETSSRPLTRGILEGRLLAQFELLSRPKMEELAKLIPDLVDGADQLLRYIATLRSNWGAM